MSRNGIVVGSALADGSVSDGASAIAARIPRRRQHVLQGFNVFDGVAQDLHFGQPLAGIVGRAPFQQLEGFVDLITPDG